MPLISIVTATYNSFPFIESTYNSIKSQSHQDWEWLVTDDASSDETLQLLMKFASFDSRVKVFHNSVNLGAAEARNVSISHASGEFIAFIDSDDLWNRQKLEKQISFMNSNVDFSFTAYRLIDEHGGSLNKNIDLNKSGSFTYEDMLRKKATLGCSTVMLRKSRFTDLRMPLLRTGQDYATWLKLLRGGTRAFVLPEVLSSYRILPNSISRNKLKKAKRQWQIYRQVEQLSILKSSTCFLNYAWRAVFR